MELQSTRKKAIEQGDSHYFTGKPCKYGHVVKRAAKSGACTECMRLQAADYRIRNVEVLVERRAKAYAADPAKYAARWQHHYPSIKAKHIAKNRKREKYLKHIGFEHEQEEIRKIYRDCPEGCHVDHDVPITHDLVCGLHCVANLQYLTAEANLKKHNKFNPETYRD